MNGARLKQLLRSKWARWAVAVSMAVKVVLVAMALWGALDHARAQLPPPASQALR